MEIRGNNEKTHLILKYDETYKQFVDVTKKIIYLKDNNTYWYTVFLNNSGENKVYKISKNSLIASNNPICIKYDFNYVYINNKKVIIDYIFKFDNLGYKIYYGKKNLFVDKLTKNNGVIFINSVIEKHNASNVLEYYKRLANYAADRKDEELSIEKLVSNLYDKISRINNDSVLYAYTNKKIKCEKVNVEDLIFPFATNKSQIEAITNTFKNNLSVISGPPGTGKTQVILNIIVNAVIQNKSIAVISNNNTAVQNVFDKMKEYDLDFLLASLGNYENVSKFFSQEDDLLERVGKIKKEVVVKQTNINKLRELYDYNNKIAKLKLEYEELEKELNHYIDTHEIVEYDYICKELYDYKEYLNLKNYLLSIKKINVFHKLVLKFKYDFRKFEFEEIDSLATYLEYLFYLKKLKSIEHKISTIEEFLKNNDQKELEKNIQENSIIRLNSYLIKKYKNFTIYDFDEDNYRNNDNFKLFVDRYPVVLSTTYSLLRNCSTGYMFDLIIIDEASQSDILSSLLTMNIAKKMVVIGDDKQLPQIDNQEIYDFSEELARELNIGESYQYKENSILDSVLSLDNISNTVLKEHYRCEQRIIQFCNKKFYNNELIICTKKSEEDSLCIVKTVEGNHARKNPHGSGQYNDREAMEILKIIDENKDFNIGIISPFRAQVEYINSLLKGDYPNVEVDTIHKYQGRQKDIIILSTVVNEINDEGDFISDFVTNSNLLNVAISRAIKKIYIVVSDKIYKNGNNTISQFIDYIKYNSFSGYKEGNIVSIYDKLYNENYEEMKKSKLYKYVDSEAEELTIKLLEKILQRYNDYKLSMHVRLMDLIKNLDGFSNEELKYIKNYKTHVDFVIFDNITMKPVLAIEVDGCKYHDYSKKQIEHDIIKDKVLKQNDIKILRLKTNQSGEEQKIIELLNN